MVPFCTRSLYSFHAAPRGSARLSVAALRLSAATRAGAYRSTSGSEFMSIEMMFCTMPFWRGACSDSAAAASVSTNCRRQRSSMTNCALAPCQPPPLLLEMTVGACGDGAAGSATTAASPRVCMSRWSATLDAS